MIRGIKFASIAVSDQQRALEFFTEKLGFKVATDQPFDDYQRLIELSIPGGESSVVLFTTPGQEDRIGGFSNVVFYSDDVQKTFDELAARGVEFSQKPQEADWGMSSMFKDPDGNVFLISSN